MKSKKIIINQRFGKLTVVELDTTPRTSTHKKWVCKCDCSNTTSVFATNLKRGSTTSCGCNSSKHNAHKLAQINTTHGLSRSKIYRVYHAMKNRCLKESSRAYAEYGGRGITICNEWINSFKNFHKWSMENGYTEGLTIERIGVDGNYEPSNCKWITPSEQTKNKRNTLSATINGETKTLKEWSVISGIKYGTIYSRKQRYGWEDEELLS